jgi:hypothetical protein
VFAPDVNMEFATTAVLCVECGLSMEGPPEMLAPSANDDDQIAYDLAEWPPEDRTIATADLVELGISYRWEDNVVLIVPAAAEEQVDAILDEIDENALADGEEVDGEALLPEDGEDGGEEAATAMSDLFIAADGLQHGTYDEQRVVEFMEAADAVAQCLPPYGIEAQVWSRVQEQASAIVAALEKGDEDEESTIAAAQALRTLLRAYV